MLVGFYVILLSVFSLTLLNDRYHRPSNELLFHLYSG